MSQQKTKVGPPYTSLDDVVWYFTVPEKLNYQDVELLFILVGNTEIKVGDVYPVTVSNYIDFSFHFLHDIEDTEEFKFFESQNKQSD